VIHSRDSTGQTLLHVAVDGMNFSAVKSFVELLIAAELINSLDNFKMTPMHIAAINFDIEIFKLLMSLKPDIYIRDNENKTCVEYLKENEEIDVDINLDSDGYRIKIN
jgi:ankyrin repeat protein